jgi:hypothetical protein
MVASDLDRTLIYSRAACALSPDAQSLTCVEIYNGAPASFMTDTAAGLLAELVATTVLVPVTTRTPAQLARITLPCPTTFAVAANGGFILVDGVVDERWNSSVRDAVALVAPLDEVWRHVESVCDPQWTIRMYQASDLFCYAIVDRELIPDTFLADITAWADDRGWSTSLQGRKLYWVPKTLTKSAALSEVRRRLDAVVILAAGDSLLDIDMLEIADAAIHPGHGEIAESGWTAPHVRRTDSVGALAGEDICRWFITEAQARRSMS